MCKTRSHWVVKMRGMLTEMRFWRVMPETVGENESFSRLTITT